MASQPASEPAFSPAASDRIEPYVWKIAGVVILGMIMSILDTTIVNVALRTLGHDLHSSIAQIQWVVTGYLLSLAAVIPITGWAARRFGAKQVYMTSLVLFTAGSALCAVATSTTANSSAIARWGSRCCSHVPASTPASAGIPTSSASSTLTLPYSAWTAAANEAIAMIAASEVPVAMRSS